MKAIGWLVAAWALALAGGGCDSSCEDGAYRCAGTVLQQCSAGEYASIEDCADRGRCMAAFGACEGTAGGGGAQGSGGSQGGGGAGMAGAAGMAAGGSGGSGG